ncbi:MAG: GlsB/YeaQ/YmgE family stress response membrane protein [Archangium sp.]
MSLTWAIVLWLLIGVSAGWLGSMVMGSSLRQGTLFDAGAGVQGAFVGGLTVQHFFASRLGDDTLVVSIAAAIGVACVALLLWRLLVKGNNRSAAVLDSRR